MRKATPPKPKPSRTRKGKDPEVIFNRSRTVPAAVKDAADLWLDMFMHFSGLIAPERPDGYYHADADNQRLCIIEAAEMADHALALYEDRWPHESHGK